ncbi:thiamine pyrophosphate-binding protein [Leucobacter allii]|uniref:thiamine pyrophosphate-dependent enzyme n=1 Tax=Leucobacter allii TaxID=2932247 RepID=UPI001FD4A1E1|nr:thiamine pyrophosphate-dependent enzyme [Leucobacter allii]UOR01516.1 thiamine pyrophosphate-binding protein [Leucobacter allii]
MSATAPSTGGVLARALRSAGVDRAFLVPGESYLPLLEGMREEGIEAVVCRNEGGASYMALADAAITGRPGVAMVTRAPGAANAMIGVSAAWQCGAPMVLMVGLVRTDERDRCSFQEFDLRGWFETTAKRVFVLDDPDRADAVLEEAMRVAAGGRPGPVVVGLPEDVLELRAASDPPSEAGTISDEPSPAVVAEVARMLEGSERPLILTGGLPWSPQASVDLARFAERHAIPVLGDFRAGDRLPPSSPANAGWIGFGAHEEAWDLLTGADALLIIGTVLGDVATRGWRLRPPIRTAVINPDPELRGHVSSPLRHLVAAAAPALRSLADTEIVAGPGWAPRMREAHRAFLASQELEAPTAGKPERPVRMAEVIGEVNARLPLDVTVAYGAGQHCLWPQRYVRKGGFPSELGLQNGSMGYSVPAAIAASLRQPGRLVVCVAGDGEFLMNGQELATAAQYGASMLLIIVDNGSYGTIREHQQRLYPGSRFAVDLENPDFAALVRAFGGEAFRIERSGEVAHAVEHAFERVRAGGIGALHVIVDEADTGA